MLLQNADPSRPATQTSAPHAAEQFPLLTEPRARERKGVKIHGTLGTAPGREWNYGGG